jgi:L-asparaginase
LVSDPAPRRSRVAVVATGGTIASLESDGTGGVAVALPISRVLGDAADLPDVDVEPVVELLRVNSWNVDPGLMWRVADCVGRLTADLDIDGVVVTHGTDTLEETAFLVDVVTSSDKPVVFTAAMRSADSRSPDGPDNLAAAIRAAASPVLRGLGVLTCLGNELHAARWVRKGHTSRLDAFGGGPGPVAMVSPDGFIRRIGGRLERWTAPGAGQADDIEADDVLVLQAYTGMSAAPLRAVTEATQTRGVVIEGFGLGHVPASLVEPIRDLVREGKVVVIATRVPAGGTRTVYGGPGGGTDLAALGVLAAGGLTAAKARLLLLACLAGNDASAAAERFQEAVEVLGHDNQGEQP